CFKMNPDVTLILGVSGCIFLPIYRVLHSSKVITNIDGLEWRRDKWGWLAKKFLKFSEKMAVRFSDVVVSDNQAIADYVLAEYSVVSKVIAYGGDHALLANQSIPLMKDDFFLALCRIEPENNVEMILNGFVNSGNRLSFIGNWESSSYGRELKLKYAHYKNITIIDSIYDVSELYQLRSRCKGYIHGHSAGGTNPSLVEAMQFGMPVYAFNCTFNRYTTDERALYFDNAVELQYLIVNYDDVAIESGNNMKKIAMNNYQWRNIVDLYELLF
ncbi:MAG: DUF1972 domain-containing protein, partial [Plesiomonas shigelloides]